MLNITGLCNRQSNLFCFCFNINESMGNICLFNAPVGKCTLRVTNLMCFSELNGIELNVCFYGNNLNFLLIAYDLL